MGQTAAEKKRPKLRNDLVVRSIRCGPKRYFEVRKSSATDDQRALRFSCSGYSVAALFNGKRTLEEVLEKACEDGIELNMRKLRALLARLESLGCLVEGASSSKCGLEEDTTEDKPTIVVPRSRVFARVSSTQEAVRPPRLRRQRFPSLPSVEAPKTGELRNYAHQLGSGLREPVPTSALFAALCACAAAGAWAGWALLRLL